MVLGTSSGAGKSLMSAALGRVLVRRGERPLPFKGQNMSLNAWVDGDGGEMAYSQALQAWACRQEPVVAMNPVLLKPQGDSTSEVIHLGRSVGIARAENYYRDWFRPGWAAIRRGLGELLATQPGGRLVLEGAGSPVEVNLQARDLTNLRLAQYLRARCLLVADIERGGVFAQLVGTLALLRPVERRLIRGILINRFRGRSELFDEGRLWLERQTGIPVLGVMPWLEEIFPPEDSLDLLERRRARGDAPIRLAVVRLPSLSNFSDFDPLETETEVEVRWWKAGEALGQPDALILPGSKQTLADLAWLRQYGMVEAVQAYAAGGGWVFGICGGLQMLGRELWDPQGLEGASDGGSTGGSVGGSAAGLDLLPLRTHFAASKQRTQRRVSLTWPEGAPLAVEGFELHHGRSEWLGDDAGHRLCGEEDLGWWRATSAGGVVAGTYLHGVFDNGAWRRRWLNGLRSRRGLAPLSELQENHASQRDRLLDRLAGAMERHVRLEPLLAPPIEKDG